MDTQLKQRLVPNIWFNRNATAAAEFYVALFSAIGRETSSRVESRYPQVDLPDFQHGFESEPLVVSLFVDGFELDFINAGEEFHATPAMSLILNFDPLLFEDETEDASTTQKIFACPLAGAGN